MKKLFALTLMLLAGRLLVAQVPYVRIEDRQTKYEQLTQQTGTLCKITDYEISTQLFNNIETSVRSVVVDDAVRYFYRIYRKEKEERPAFVALVAYDDLVELNRELESMIEEERKDRNARKDYCETFYRTEDGFQIGYFIKNRQTNWYLVQDRYSQNKVFFDSGTKLKDHFKKAMTKFEEVMKKNGN